MKVLVVDDNPVNRLLPITWLSNAGHEAVECCSGYEALERLGGGRYDAMLLDLSMPGLSGTEVCRQLREQPEHADMRIVAYTAYLQPELVSGFQEAGFDAVLIKPVTRKAAFKALGIE